MNMKTLDNKDNVFHRFLIWPLIAGLRPYEKTHNRYSS